MKHGFILQLVRRLVRFVDWLFGKNAAGIDFGLSAFAGGWAYLMIVRPAMFDRSSFAGMSWLPDEVWTGLMVALTLLHLLGFIRHGWIGLRTGAALLSSWVWMFIAISLYRVELTPGVFTYSTIGAGALAAAIYIAGTRQRVA